MPKEEWGVKRVCPKCGTRFYDLMQDPMTCPSCGYQTTLDALLGQRGRGATPAKSVGKPIVKDEIEAEDDDVVIDDEADVDLDDDVLEDDDDDSVSLDDLADVAADDDDT